MNTQLKREFVFVYHSSGNNTIRPSMIDQLRLTKNDAGNCIMTECSEAITIVCRSLNEFNETMYLSMNQAKEGPTLRFLSALQKALVKFIG